MSLTTHSKLDPPASGAADLPEARLFTKKPVTIAAIQWTGKNLREVIAFTDGPPDTRTTHAGMAWEAYTDLVARDGLKIYTLEGKMLASPGDWIIRGVKGEYYPCKPDIFEATYSPAALAWQATAAPAPQTVARDELTALRKQDTELIRQLLNALELPGTKTHQMLLQCAAAARAGRARLDGKP